MSAFPGMTSTIDLAKGLISIQTEVNGDPPRVVSIALHRGRVVKKVAVPLHAARALDPSSTDAANIEKVHRAFERNLREALRGVARSKTLTAPQATIAGLFMRVIESYLRGDKSTAIVVLEALTELDPADRRLQSSLDHLRREFSAETTLVTFEVPPT